MQVMTGSRRPGGTARSARPVRARAMSLAHRRTAAALLSRRSTAPIGRHLSLWATAAPAAPAASNRGAAARLRPAQAAGCAQAVGAGRRWLADKAEIDLTIATLEKDKDLCGLPTFSLSVLAPALPPVACHASASAQSSALPPACAMAPSRPDPLRRPLPGNKCSSSPPRTA